MAAVRVAKSCHTGERPVSQAFCPAWQSLKGSAGSIPFTHTMGVNDMIFLRINNQEYPASDVSESTLNQEIIERRRQGLPVCVVARFDMPDIHMSLSAGQCSGMGGGRIPTPTERKIAELWDQMVANRPEFNGNDIIAFLKMVG